MDRQEIATIQVECQQFLSRVTTLMDAGDWDELAACYVDDGVLFRPADPENGIEGREAILASFKARTPRTTCHILSNIYCNVVASDKVIATSRVWLVAGEASQSFPVKADSKLLVGSFEDTLVLRDNRWLIQCRRGGIELRFDYA